MPRDRVLNLLRDRKSSGATTDELSKLTPRWNSHVGNLREEGSTIKGVSGKDGWRLVLIEERRKLRRRKLVTQSEEYARIARAIENLDYPAKWRNAWQLATRTARLLRRDWRLMEESPNFSQYTLTLEDGFLQFAGKHLKRWTYLMAVAKTAVKGGQTPVPDLAQSLFETLHKRLTRSRHGKK